AETFKLDTIAPTLAITTNVQGILLPGAMANMTFTFSEPVPGFKAADIAVVGGNLGSLSTNDSGKTWTATFTNDSDPATKPSITVNDNKYTDIAGNNGTGATINWVPPVIKSFVVIDDFSRDGLNNPSSEYGVNSGNYGTSYKYQGTVVNETGLGVTQGLTNDRTPTLNITLNEAVNPAAGEKLVIQRYIKDPIKGWVVQEDVTSKLTTTDGLTYTLTDKQLPETYGQEYRYQMQIKSNDSAGQSIVVSQQQADFTLDTRADVLQNLNYSGGVLTGSNMEQGTVFVDTMSIDPVTGKLKGNGILDAGELSAKVAANGSWSINFAGATIKPTDSDTWDETNNKPFVNVFDEFVALDFVDKAGNTIARDQRLYLFDLDDNKKDGQVASLDRDDRPRDAQITMKNINSGLEWIDSDGDGNLNYALVWDHQTVTGAGANGLVNESKELAAGTDQLVIVVGDVGAQSNKAKDLFDIYTGSGNDSFNIQNGNMQINTRINLGSGNDVFTLDGDMDGGTGTQRHDAFSLRLDTGTGDDTANIGQNFKRTTADKYVTDGVVISMGAGNDRLVFENGDLIDTIITMDQSTTNLRSGNDSSAPIKPIETSTDGNDYLEVRGNIDNTTYIYMGGGNDIAKINNMNGSDTTTLLDMGSGDDLVNYSGNDITGIIDGGRGFDILRYDSGGNQTLYTDDFIGFELIDMIGDSVNSDTLYVRNANDIVKNSTDNNQLFVNGERGDTVRQFSVNNKLTKTDLFADSDGDLVSSIGNGTFKLDTGRNIKAVFDTGSQDTKFVYLDSEGNKTAENYEGNIYRVFDATGNAGYQWLIDTDISVEGFTLPPII
ncbi:Ig-like domain-containing protein, partial [Psychrobacter urativorans]|uniref:Ig-like domain-containing protein n=1 Tax=Psychrobacter urativorans TaxID=45610 RepID=UPI003BB77463